ncbi:MAG: hypothetical protein LBD79_01545 [Treponema sp.]|nr:hypothetical protein [Treponema sp.]
MEPTLGDLAGKQRDSGASLTHEIAVSFQRTRIANGFLKETLYGACLDFLSLFFGVVA